VLVLLSVSPPLSDIIVLLCYSLLSVLLVPCSSLPLLSLSLVSPRLFVPRSLELSLPSANL
jgi:hypothetical protein